MGLLVVGVVAVHAGDGVSVDPLQVPDGAVLTLAVGGLVGRRDVEDLVLLNELHGRVGAEEVDVTVTNTTKALGQDSQHLEG